MIARSRAGAVLWEIWRVTRAEAAWKLAFGIVGGLAVLGLGATFAPADDATRYQRIMDDCAAIAMVLLVLPHTMGWHSPTRLNGGQPGFPLYLHYTRPVRTVVSAGVPLAYLTALSWAIYLASALLLRAASGLAFPLLPIAAWMAAITVVVTAATWSTRNRTIAVLAVMIANLRALGVSMERLTAVELPGGYDWPPRLWPTLFDFPRTDYAWIAVIGLASFAITVAMVNRQRHGDALSPPARVSLAAPAGAERGGRWEKLVGAFRFPCPTSSATRAQVWLDLRSNGWPVVTIGVSLAIAILLVSAVSGRIDAAINANPGVQCPIGECFYARAWPPLMTPLSLVVVLLLAGNAFGIRRRQGRTYVSGFEATQAHGAARLAALKLLVKSACVLAALLAIGISAWISFPLLGDGVFIQMWGVPLNSQLSAVNDAVAALRGYEQLALVVVAAAGVVIWVAAFAVLGALWARYSRRVNIAGSLLLLYGLVLGLLAVAAQRGIGPQVPLGAILRATSWVAASAIVVATVYVFWRVLAEQLLTVRQAWGVVLLWTGCAAASATVLRAAGLSLASLPAADTFRLLSPALLPLTIIVLAPWSYSRVRHT